MRDILGFHRHSKALGSRSILASFAGKLWDAESVAEAAEVRNKVAALSKAPGFSRLEGGCLHGKIEGSRSIFIYFKAAKTDDKRKKEVYQNTQKKGSRNLRAT